MKRKREKDKEKEGMKERRETTYGEIDKIRNQHKSIHEIMKRRKEVVQTGFTSHSRKWGAKCYKCLVKITRH